MKKGLIGFVVVAITGIALWWCHGQRAATRSTPHERSAAGSAVRIPTVPVATGPARAEVSVSDAKGPLAHATVRFISEAGAIEVATATTDGVAHAELAPGTWTISASAAGHIPNAVAARAIASGETATIAIVLVAGGRPLTGLVTDTSGGPVVGARVDAASLGRDAHASTAVASTQTGADGHYTLAVSEGEVLVAVNHPDYAPQQRYAEVNATGAVVDFQLVPGGVIEGVVRDATAKSPIANASVDAQLDRTSLFGEVTAHQVTAGADGHFRITGLRPGAYSLSAQAGDLLSTTPTVVGLGVAEQVSDVVILVSRGAAIRGIVVDDDNAPVPNANVGLLRDNPQHDTKSDAKGAFALTGLAPGAYAISADNADFVWTRPVTVELGSKDIEGVRVRVHRGVHVKGQIEPAQVCDVDLELAQPSGPMRFDRPSAGAGADGAFVLGPIAAGAYTASAHCPSGDEGTAPIAAKLGMSDVTIAVRPGGSIAGRVVDGKGKPVAGASVNAGTGNRTEIINGMVTSGSAALTGADGTFELTGLGAASYRLSVLDRGRPLPMKTAAAAATIALAPAEKKTGVQLVVDRPDGVIQGTVTGPDGKPLPDAWVSADQGLEDMLAGLGGDGESRELRVESRSDGGGTTNAIAPVLTDANGRFSITGLTRVPWTVTAEAQGGKLRGRVEKVKPDATIAIAVASVRELHGTVHSDAPPGWFSVELDGPTSAQRTFAWTDGTFSFARVDPGTYTVKVTSSAGTGEGKVTIGAAENGSVDITLTSNGMIVGKLVDQDGRPLPEVGVTVIPDTGDGRIQIQLSGPPPTTGPDGSFSVPSKPGKMILVAMMRGAPAMKPGLVVQAGQTLDIGTFVASPKPPPH